LFPNQRIRDINKRIYFLTNIIICINNVWWVEHLREGRLRIS
jgi:hypothetical protein